LDLLINVNAEGGKYVCFKSFKVNSKNHLEIGGCDCVDLVNNFGTPLYVMDESLIRENCRYIKMHWTSIITETDWYFTPARLSVQWQCAKLSSRKAWVLTWYRAESCTPRLKRDSMEEVYFHGNNKPLTNWSWRLTTM